MEYTNDRIKELLPQELVSKAKESCLLWFEEAMTVYEDHLDRWTELRSGCFSEIVNIEYLLDGLDEVSLICDNRHNKYIISRIKPHLSKIYELFYYFVGEFPYRIDPYKIMWGKPDKERPKGEIKPFILFCIYLGLIDVTIENMELDNIERIYSFDNSMIKPDKKRVETIYLTKFMIEISVFAGERGKKETFVELVESVVKLISVINLDLNATNCSFVRRVILRERRFIINLFDNVKWNDPGHEPRKIYDSFSTLLELEDDLRKTVSLQFPEYDYGGSTDSGVPKSKMNDSPKKKESNTSDNKSVIVTNPTNNITNLFEGAFGPANGDLRLALTGTVAVRCSDGRYKTYDVEKDHLIIVSDFTMNGTEGMFFIIPTTNVKKGDLIYVKDKLSFVSDVTDDGNRIKIVNYEDDKIEEILPERYLLWGKTYFFKKIICPFHNIRNANSKSIRSIMKLLMFGQMFGNGNTVPVGSLISNGNNNLMMNLLMLIMMKGDDSNELLSVFDDIDSEISFTNDSN